MRKKQEFVLPVLKVAVIIIIFILILAFFIWFAYSERNVLFFVLTPFVISLILAYLLHPVVNFMENRRISRTLSILVIYIVFGMIIYILCVRFLPILLADLQELVNNLPEYARYAQDYIVRIQEDYRRFNLPPALRDIIDENLEGMEKALISRLEHTYTFLLGFFNSVLILLLVPILTFFIIRDERKIKDWVVGLIPPGSRRRFLQMTGEIDSVIGHYLRGMVVISIMVGFAVYIGLLLLGVEYALFLGLFNGITNFIPFVGPFIGAVPAVIVGFISSPVLALKVAILILVIQQLESNLLAPLVFSRTVKFHPLTIILLLLLGGKLFGFVGLLLVIPVAAVIRIIGKHLLGIIPRYIR